MAPDYVTQAIYLHRVVTVAKAFDLSLNEWAVLGLVGQDETHGFALSKEFAPGGSIGSVWTIPRPLIYRALRALAAQGLIAEIGTAPGAGGPRRQMVKVTRAGRDALSSWLVRPTAHVRDARSELLVKLFLFDRAGESPRELLVAQAALLQPMLDGLRGQLHTSEGFDSTVLRWRLHVAEALEQLIGELIEETSTVS